MKKLFFKLLVVMIVTVAAITTYKVATTHQLQLTSRQEALACQMCEDDPLGVIECPEVTVTCSGGDFGKCKVISQMSTLFGKCVYVCLTTGRQDDNCPAYLIVLANVCNAMSEGSILPN